MTRQLALLDPPAVDWRIDERTKQLGRQGIAAARAALESARREAEGRYRGPSTAEPGSAA